MPGLPVTEYLKLINTIIEACRLLNKNKGINVRYHSDQEVQLGGSYFIKVNFISYFPDGTDLSWTTEIGEVWATHDFDARDSLIGIKPNMPADKKCLLRVAYAIWKDYLSDGRKQ